MISRLTDAYLAPVLFPVVLSTNLLNQPKDSKSDLLYTTVVFGTVLSAISSLLQFHLNRYTRSRTKLTLLTASLMTTSSVAAIAGFNIIRSIHQTTSYDLPLSIRGQVSDAFRYHFFADFIPGFIIFSQAQLCTMINHDLMTKAKRKFIFGEASIIAQLASAAYLTWALTIYTEMSGAGPFKVHLTTGIILNIGMIIFSIVFIPCYYFLRSKATGVRYALIILGLVICYSRIQTLISPTSSLDPLTWFVDYIFSTHQRIGLFSLWLSTLTGCVSFSTSWARMAGQTNSLVRKVFHLAVCVVFISGYNQDLDFTQFAAGGMILVMFFLEMARAWRLEPVGDYLETVCQALRGKSDNRYLTLSHMYLLVGAFLPLWILPRTTVPTSKLALSSGLISIGIGDTAAAVVGTFLGKTKILETGKTVEGFVGNCLAMLLFKLYWVGFLGYDLELSFAIGVFLTALVEVITKMCDNLLLPLVMILYIEFYLGY